MWAHYVLRTLLTAPSDNRIGNFMKTTKITKLLGASIAAAVLLLNGCGGGTSAGTASTTTPPTTTTPTGEPIPTLNLTLTDAATGASTNSLSLGNPAIASAKVLDHNKSPIPNVVVTFSADPATLVAFAPGAGTALTDAKGVATVQLSPAAVSAAGAGTLTATTNARVSWDGITFYDVVAKGSTGFNVGAASIGLSGMAVGQNPLSPYGTTGVTVNITGVPTTYPVTVNFASTCAGSGKATLTASTQSINGVATANYTDNKCASNDTITASVAGTTVSTSTSLSVQAPSVASIQFISTSHDTIVIKGTGAAGFQEASLVKFKVVDNNNQPVSNTSVKFDLSTRTGGILLENSASAVSKLTDANGEVQVSVQAGANPTPVWVIAEVSAGALTFKTQSIKLTISTGRPAQDRMSLAVGTFNIEGFNVDGTKTDVTARVSDRLGNPVPNGTTINFVSSGGQIQPSCQTTDGACSIFFTSSNPRPTGRVAVLAYTLGEESFYDANGNGVYESGEAFNDLGNVFLDNDRDGVYDAGAETKIVFDAANVANCVRGVTSSPFAPSEAATCDGKWGSAHVRQDNVITLSGSTAFINETQPIEGFTPNTTYSMNGACTTTVSFFVFDVNRNPMPANSKIATTSLPEDVTATVLNDSVANTTATGGTRHSITVKKKIETDGSCPSPSSTFTVPVVVTTPKGNGTILGLTINP